ncbi:unnamed protein product [Cunninghamella blakesleeana]
MEQEKKLRNWKGTDGRFETEATFISLFQGDKIKLRKATGGIIAIPIQRLCDRDKEYLKQHIGLTEWNNLFSNLQDKNNHVISPSTLPSRNSSVLSTNINTINNNNNTISTKSTLNNLNNAMNNLSIKNTTHTSSSTSSSPSSLKVSIKNDIFINSNNNNNNNNNNSNNNNVVSPQSFYSHYSSNYSPTSPIQQQQQQSSSNIYHSNHSSTTPMHHLHQYNPVLSQPPPPYQMGNYSPTKATHHHHPYDFSYHIYHQQQQQQQYYHPQHYHHYQQQQLVIKKRKSLIDLPNQVIIQIGSLLDTKSRIRLLRTSKHLRTIILHYDVWHYIDFLKKDTPFIDNKSIHQLLNVLRESQLHYSPKMVNLDHTSIKADTVSFMLQFFPAIRHLSIRHCPSMDYHQLAINLNQLSISSPNGSAICQPNLLQFSMLSKKTIEPIHGSDIEMIQQSLNVLAKKMVILDCQVCDQCKIAACTSTLTCIHCGVIPIKRCLACAPSCDHCQGRVCGGNHCKRIPHLLSFQISDCGRCQLPLALCNQPSCMSTIISPSSSSSTNKKMNQNDHHQHQHQNQHHNHHTGIAKMRQRHPCKTPWDINQKEKQHGYFHSTCKIKTKLVSNQCTKCGVIACPFCELMKCGGGCHGQFCSSCVTTMDLKHCKCILIHGVVGTKMSKRNVCHQCQLDCHYCTDAASSSISSSSSSSKITSFKMKAKTNTNTTNSNTYCYRCLDLHQKECEHKNRIEKKKSKRKQKK